MKFCHSNASPLEWHMFKIIGTFASFFHQILILMESNFIFEHWIYRMFNAVSNSKVEQTVYRLSRPRKICRQTGSCMTLIVRSVNCMTCKLVTQLVSRLSLMTRLLGNIYVCLLIDFMHDLLRVLILLKLPERDRAWIR